MLPHIGNQFLSQRVGEVKGVAQPDLQAVGNEDLVQILGLVAIPGAKGKAQCIGVMPGARAEDRPAFGVLVELAGCARQSCGICVKCAGYTERS